jgi:hypothetical protein
MVDAMSGTLTALPELRASRQGPAASAYWERSTARATSLLVATVVKEPAYGAVTDA